MKMKLVFIPILIIFTLSSACGSAVTPTAEQKPTISVTEVENTPLQPTTAPIPYQVVTLKINESRQASYAPIYIALAEGYFSEYGIELESIPFKNPSDVMPLLITGNIDIYAGGVSAGLIKIVGSEPNVKVVADRGHMSSGDCAYQAIVVRKDLFDSGQVTSAKDLKEQHISALITSANGFLLSAYLKQAGLTFSDADIQDIPAGGFVDAFANKSLAAIVTQEPSITRLLKAGNAVILATATDVLGSNQSAVLTFGKSLIADNPDAGVRFLAAYLKGVAQYNQGKTERNVDIITEATGETRETILDSCWVPIRVDGAIDFPAVDKFQQWSIGQGLLDQAATEEQFWDQSYLVAARKLLDQ